MPIIHKEHNLPGNGVYRLKLQKLKSKISGEGASSKVRDYSPADSKAKINYPVIEKKKSFSTLFAEAIPIRNKSPFKIYNPLMESKNENLSTICDETTPSHAKPTTKSIDKILENEIEGSVLPGIKTAKLYDQGTQAYIETLMEELYKKKPSASVMEKKRYNSVIDVRSEQIAQPVCKETISPEPQQQKTRSLSKGQNIPKLQDFYLLRDNQKLNSYKPLARGLTSKDQKDPIQKLIQYNDTTRIKLLAPLNRGEKKSAREYKGMSNHELSSLIEKEGSISQGGLLDRIQQIVHERNKAAPNKSWLNVSRKIENKSVLSKDEPRPFLEIDCVGGKSQRNTQMNTEEDDMKEIKENKQEDKDDNRREENIKYNSLEDLSKAEKSIEEDEIEREKSVTISPPRRVLISYKDRKEIMHMNEEIKGEVFCKNSGCFSFANKEVEKSGLNNSDESSEPFIIGNNKITSFVQDLR